MSFTFDAANKTLTADGYTFSEAGGIVKNNVAVGTKDIGEAKKAFSEAFKKFASTSGLNADQLKQIRALADHHDIAEVKGTFTAVGEIETLLAGKGGSKLAASDLAKLEALYVAHPNSVNMVNQATTDVLTHAEHGPLSGLKKLATRVTGLNDALFAAVKEGPLTEEALEKLLQAHGPELKGYIKPHFVSGLDVSKVAAKVETEIGDFAKIYKGHLDAIANEQRILDALPKDAAASVREAQAAKVSGAVEALEGSLKGKETLKPHMEKVFADHPEKAVLDKIEKLKPITQDISKAASSSPIGAIGKAASEASKTEWGWSKKLAPKAEGITGALWKNRGVLGKAGVVAGAGAVLYAIVSAVGGKGPGEKAAEVNRGREQSQGQAVGA